MVVQSLTNWKLAGFWPYTPIQSGSMETGHIHQGVTGVIDATVPGSIYADLLRAGLIQVFVSGESKTGPAHHAKTKDQCEKTFHDTGLLVVVVWKIQRDFTA